MASYEFTDLVKKLSQRINTCHHDLKLSERNEEWTKFTFIVPILVKLGWDSDEEIRYEGGSDDDDGRLDLILKYKTPIGLEAKAIDVTVPQNPDHPQIKKGIKQARVRGTSYFIWTNGDCWQFYSLSLPNAPIYQLFLSEAINGPEQLESVIKKFLIIEKDTCISNPDSFNEIIYENWKKEVLAVVCVDLLKNHSQELIELIRKDLPTELKITNDEIQSLLSTFKLLSDVTQTTKTIFNRKEVLSFPEAWSQLLDSYEDDCERARERFLEGNCYKFANYLVSENYQPWSKSITWRIVGTSKDTNERKKLGGVISLFIRWRFIEELPSEKKYRRIEESISYLKKLLNTSSKLVPAAKKQLANTNKIDKKLITSEDWEKLLTSFETVYERTRNRLKEGNCLKLGKYLLGKECKPWPKSTTWRIVGLSKDPNERKGLGVGISLFLKWNLIEELPGSKMYRRVDKSIPYLKKIIEETI